MREILICILGSILGLSVMVNIILLASTWSAIAATTSNLLTDDFNNTAKWQGTNQSIRHGDNIIAFVDGGSVNSTVSLDDHLLQSEINTGFSATLNSEVWYWNNTPNQSVTSTLTIVGTDGTNFEQNIVSEGICSNWNACGYEDLGTNTIVVGTNTQSNFDITSTFTATAPGTSGHYAADLRLPELYVTYDEFSLTFDTDVTDIASNIEESLSFDALEFEQDFDFIFLEPVDTEMIIEIAPEILFDDDFFLSEEFTEFGFDETITFDEPMDLSIEEMPMDMPTGMYEDTPMLDLYTDDTMLSMYSDEPMPEDILLMPLPMVYEDEEIAAAEPEQEMVIVEQEYTEEVETEMVEETPTDEQLQEFPNNEPLQEEEFVEEQVIEETTLDDEVMLVEETISIEETPTVEVVQQEKPSVNVVVKFSDIVMADFNKIKTIIQNQQVIIDQPFYAPKNIYTNQPVLVDNRQLYQNVSMAIDPLVAHEKKLYTNRLQQAELKFKLERLHGIN